MTEQIERILRSVEDQFPGSQYEQGIADVRAAVWTARSQGTLPARVTETPKALIYHHQDFDFHVTDGFIYVGENQIQLTPSETRILAELATSPNVVISGRQLAVVLTRNEDHVATDEKTVKVHISHLRRKMREGRNGLDYLVDNVHGFGYRLLDPSLPGYTPSAKLK